MSIVDRLRKACASYLGETAVSIDPQVRRDYGTDALLRGADADLVVWPSSTGDVQWIMRQATEAGMPVVTRGAGTGYTGGAVPTSGGMVVCVERMNRILELDVRNQVAVVQPGVITADLQRAAEAAGLWYPPDPASLHRSSIGGNIAEGAGGPRAVKYGTTRRYVLGLEVVLASGTVIRTGSRAVKNVVGYDLTQLMVGSEGTLGIITEATMRLVPRPAHVATLQVFTDGIDAAVAVVDRITAAGITPSTIEVVDAGSLAAAERYAGRTLAPSGTGALLIIEVDGTEGGIRDEARVIVEAARLGPVLGVDVAHDPATRDALWETRRSMSYALRASAPRKINHDVSVPRGRLGELYRCIAALEQAHGLWIPSFGHAGDGNIHVNIMIDPDDADAVARAERATSDLFEAVVSMQGSISGEHGIGFSKARYLPIELAPDVVALMQRVKAAFDPDGRLNPGKIWPDAPLPRV
ncbi:MAG: FAD-binding protein [Acidobacteria bacterium]|nr:FAD-binding protein [Acidobacteriota bacterium]